MQESKGYEAIHCKSGDLEWGGREAFDSFLYFQLLLCQEAIMENLVNIWQDK